MKKANITLNRKSCKRANHPCKKCGHYTFYFDSEKDWYFCKNCYINKLIKREKANLKLKAEKLKEDLEIAKETNSYEGYDI